MDAKKYTVLYNLIFPIWVFVFMPNLIPVIFAINFMIDGAIIWYYLKRHNKFNNIRIYCFRSMGSEQDLKQELNKRTILSYTFQAALFGYAADFFGGIVMLELLEVFPFNKLDYYHIWSNFTSVLLHILVIFIVGFMIYLFHRYRGRRLNLSPAEAKGLGIVMGIFTAPWVILIPTYLFY